MARAAAMGGYGRGRGSLGLSPWLARASAPACHVRARGKYISAMDRMQKAMLVHLSSIRMIYCFDNYGEKAQIKIFLMDNERVGIYLHGMHGPQIFPMTGGVRWDGLHIAAGPDAWGLICNVPFNEPKACSFDNAKQEYQLAFNGQTKFCLYFKSDGKHREPDVRLQDSNSRARIFKDHLEHWDQHGYHGPQQAYAPPAPVAVRPPPVMPAPHAVQPQWTEKEFAELRAARAAAEAHAAQRAREAQREEEKGKVWKSFLDGIPRSNENFYTIHELSDLCYEFKRNGHPANWEIMKKNVLNPMLNFYKEHMEYKIKMHSTSAPQWLQDLWLSIHSGCELWSASERIDSDTLFKQLTDTPVYSPTTCSDLMSLWDDIRHHAFMLHFRNDEQSVMEAYDKMNGTKFVEVGQSARYGRGGMHLNSWDNGVALVQSLAAASGKSCCTVEQAIEIAKRPWDQWTEPQKQAAEGFFFHAGR